MPLTDAQLDEIGERAAAASPGPWTPRLETRGGIGGASFIQAGADPDMDDEIHVDRWIGGRRLASPDPRLDADLAFIAEARRDVPRLVAEVRRLRALLAERDRSGPPS